MSYEIVYRSLTELFPQIDARLLKAVAIEHPKDADEAAAVVLSEIVPEFYPNSADNSTHSGNSKDGDLGFQSKARMELNGSVESLVVSSDPPAFDHATTKLTSDSWQHSSRNQAESSTSAVSSDDVHKVVYQNSESTQKSSRNRFGFGSSDDVKEASSGSLAGESSDADLVDETSKGSLAVENSHPELGGGAFSSTVSRSTQRCKIDHLEQIIEDAKSNKRTLFTVMESIMNLMREVELQEKEAEKVKEDATRGGCDTLKKVEELKKILTRAKEGNDMDAGEVYGERSILSTEVNELENRLLNLSEERDKSLSVLNEMRGVLEMRLAAVLEIKNAAELVRQVKEGSARKALAEQEAIMEKVVQESKLIQQEAEENSKLREFLMDRGRIVDSLQGEISVICQDILLLKEKFDNRVPLSESITSSQTSCKLASSFSSMKSLLVEKPLELSYETPEASSNNESPKALVNEGKDKSPKALVNEGEGERKELLEDGWELDFFEKLTEI